MFFFFSSRRRHTRYWRDWSSDVCSSDLGAMVALVVATAVVVVAALVVVTAVVFAAYTICLQCPRICIFGAVGWLLEDRAPDSIWRERRAPRLPHAVGWGRRERRGPVPERAWALRVGVAREVDA